MTAESFCTIRELSEVPEGLRIQHRDGQISLLRRDKSAMPESKRFCDWGTG